ncbi:MAG: type II CAAX endopeptidase family protein [Acidobacteriota bacterium]
MNERLNRADWLFLAVCAVVVAVSLFVAIHWFAEAFPEASIDFRYDRKASLRVAEPLIAAQRLDVRGMKHTATFSGDNNARIFLERSLGLAKASAIMRRDVRLWWWSHRWFKPLQEEEYRIDVAPTGEIVGFGDKIPEDRALPSPEVPAARAIAETFLTRVGVKLADLQPVAQSERRLPRRMQRIFTYDSQSVHPAGAPYRYVVTVDGDRVSSYSQRVHVPDQWQREYRELRSKNLLAGNIDLVFMIITAIAAVVIFVVRLLRGDLALRMLLGIGAAAVVLVTGVAINSYPSALADYDTTSSFPAFLALFSAGALLQGVGYAMLLIVIVGSGEVLYRQRFPQHLAMPRLWTKRALASKRVFRSFILGYTLVAFFLGYQVAFYLIAEKFGAWSPAEVPYDDLLNSALPWVVVLFAGFFPALSEEFLSRAFSIPFFERVLRSRVAAIVIAGFIWGFGHATYPNQPFYIRGLEVGLAGVLMGGLLVRFGLLPLLIWHYTIDALYTALLLLRSGNTYYVVSGALSSLVFAVPMLISIALYVRNKGFIPDDDLTNATIPTKPEPERLPHEEAPVELPPPVPVSRAKLMVCVVAVVVAIGVVAMRIPSLDDVVDYRTTKTEAKKLAGPSIANPREHILAAPVEGFRSWEREAPREDGGAPGGFDAIAAGHALHKGLPMRALLDVMRTKIEAATWMIRAYTPLQKEEYFVEVDPRAARVIGYHKYQDEKRAGPRLEQPPALAIAEAAFPRYGVDLKPFELKEALSFQQPARRDWLFHFQERQPIVADVYRRVSVRVAGDEVTQFTTTVKIPDVVYRQPTTLLNIVFALARLLGALTVLALIIAGFVVALRAGHFPWRRALRWTLVLAIIPIASTAAGWEMSLFDYNTSVGWQTFIAGQWTSAARNVGLQLGVIFLAIAGIEAAYPGAFELRRRAARARFGRAALIGALATIALLILREGALNLIAVRFPTAAAVHGLNVPSSVAQPLPALLAIGETIIRVILGSAAVALFIVALRGLRWKPWLPTAVAITAMFLAGLDASATPAETPLMLASAASLAVIAWAAARFLLQRNLLAYPLTIALAALVSSVSILLQGHRPDLFANAMAEIAVIAALVVWIAAPSERAEA